MLCSWAGRFESTLVTNPKDRFSRDIAHIWTVYVYCTVIHPKGAEGTANCVDLDQSQNLGSLW